MKHLVGKKMMKSVKFMGEDLRIGKLSVADVFKIQELAKDASDDDSKSMDLLRHVIRASVEGAADLTDEDFDSFPMEELSALSSAIMKFSGLDGAGASQGN